MGQQPKPPNPLLRRWEQLETWQQIVIAGPALIVLLFVLNVGPMAQPVERSAGYGLLEGVVLTALLIVATRHERSKRRPPQDHDEGADDE
jgi:hypothetical protein